jgi:hypothetical protein
MISVLTVGLVASIWELIGTYKTMRFEPLLGAHVSERSRVFSEALLVSNETARCRSSRLSLSEVKTSDVPLRSELPPNADQGTRSSGFEKRV